MKESRRHRWVSIGSYPIADTRALSVCRDCGLEVATHRVKAGDLGPCAGKACEHQNILQLMDRVPQDVQNTDPGLYFCACVGCGTMIGLEMLAHRNPETGKITGWIFTCEKCRPTLADSRLIFTPKEVKEVAAEDTG